jgi:outer membrane lipoprotein-sorting protein
MIHLRARVLNATALIPFLALFAAGLLASCRSEPTQTATPAAVDLPTAATGAAAGTAPAAGSTSGLPEIALTPAEMAERLAEAMAKPPKMRMVAEIKMDTEMQMLGQTVGTQMTMDTEQWNDGDGRSRTEAVTSTDVDMGGMGDMPAASETKSTVVSDGETTSVWIGAPIDGWFEANQADLMQKDLSPEGNAQWIQKMLGEVVGKYDIQLQGTDTVAGREVYVAIAKPKSADDKGHINPMMTIEAVELAVDAETWQVLRMELDGGVDLTAALAMMASGPSGTPAAGDTAGSPSGKVHMAMEATEVDYDPDLPEDLFTFTPPPGAKKIEMPAGGGMFNPLGGGR